MIDINLLRKLNKPENIVITEHARVRLSERGISVDEILEAIDSGEIIEQYEADKPFPSCLILGSSTDTGYLHVVVGMEGRYIYLITAYRPDPDRWAEDRRSRK